jgi:nicotinamide phosphoribosyltransferase
MNSCSPMLLADFYKISHKAQYPAGTEVVYSTWIPRTSRMTGVDHVVAFGFQAFIKKYLIEYFNEHFFNKSKLSVITEYSRIISATLGIKNPDTKHIEDLHNLGYLPIKISALAEGTLCPLRVPMLVLENTNDKFFWLTNFLETLMSCELWLAATSATTAHEYKKILNWWAEKTDETNMGFVQFQGHDFSMRGMASLEAAELSGAGHLLSFVGTDTIPAICHLERYYNADVSKELVGTSIPASEHSVACAYGKDNEQEYYRRLIEDVYPTGFVSLVSDTWNFWEVLDKIIRSMRDTILTRDGKVVIRPDSGDPVKIICGDPESPDPLVRKGAVEILWDIFGGTINSQGYKCLDSHIGCIYGDAITLTRCQEICENLAAKKFASTNVVYGIGSYTYNYKTRDTFGFALKSTYVKVNGEERMIMKDPITDPGSIKKSLTGKCVVGYIDGDTSKLQVIDGLTEEEINDPNGEENLLKVIFENGVQYNIQTLQQVRDKLANG